MKKLISLFLCFGLIFFAVGCKKNASPEEIEQKITKELQECKQFDGHINAKISGNVEGLDGKEITMDTDIKADMTGDFPIMYMSGNVGIEGMITMPLTLYFDENGMIISAMGMSEKQELSDEDKEDIKKAIKQSSGINLDIEKTVKSTKIDGKDALEITYDVNQINDMIKSFSEDSKQEVTIDKFVSYYILKNRDELDYMTANYVMTVEGQSLNCDATIKYNSIGQPVEITPPSVDSSSSGSGLGSLLN